MGNYGRQGLHSAIAPLYREIRVVAIGWRMAETVGSKVYATHGLPSADCKITRSPPQTVLTLEIF
jgi:hypothetical protein